MDDDLTPEETERVRRLLADARHTEPIPDHVVTRIDQALADLASEPATAAPVVRLAERRRNAGRLLLAAAAVVVGGVALGQVVGGDGQDEASTDSTTASEAEPAAPDRDGELTDRRGMFESPDAEGAEPLPGAVSDTRRSISKLSARQIRPQLLAVDAERLRPLATAQEVSASSARAPRSADLAELDGCSPGVWGGGRYVRVAYGQEAGWLVYRAPRGDTQVVDLFLCGDDSPERSATLPFDGS